MIHRSFVRGKTGAAVLTSLGLALFASRVSAQFTPPTASPAGAAAAIAEATFDFSLGRTVVEREGGASSTYTVDATQAYGSKSTSGKVRLTVIEKDAGGSTTHVLTVNAGKYKTIAQLSGILADVFRKDLEVVAANQEIGKIGDLNHGGEIRFIAESPDVLRYDWQTPGEPVHSTRFKRTDIQVFLGILTHPKAGG